MRFLLAGRGDLSLSFKGKKVAASFVILLGNTAVLLFRRELNPSELCVCLPFETDSSKFLSLEKRGPLCFPIAHLYRGK